MAPEVKARRWGDLGAREGFGGVGQNGLGSKLKATGWALGVKRVGGKMKPKECLGE